MILLPVLVHTEQSSKFDELGIDYTLDSLETEEVLFVTIDNMSRCRQFEGCTKVTSGGFEYICTMSMMEIVEQLFEEQENETKQHKD